VFTIAIKDITPPTTEKRPKSSTPSACKAKRVVNNPAIAVIISLAYRIIELRKIALFVFSCITSYFY